MRLSRRIVSPRTNPPTRDYPLATHDWVLPMNGNESVSYLTESVGLSQKSYGFSPTDSWLRHDSFVWVVSRLSRLGWMSRVSSQLRVMSQWVVSRLTNESCLWLRIDTTHSSSHKWVMSQWDETRLIHRLTNESCLSETSRVSSNEWVMSHIQKRILNPADSFIRHDKVPTSHEKLMTKSYGWMNPYSWVSPTDSVMTTVSRID